MSAVRHVSLLVCGEPMRGDDAVAAQILAALPATTRRLVDVRTVSGLMPDDLVETQGPVIVLDAGARLVQLYTGLIYGGPGLVRAVAHRVARATADGGRLTDTEQRDGTEQRDDPQRHGAERRTGG